LYLTAIAVAAGPTGGVVAQRQLLFVLFVVTGSDCQCWQAVIGPSTVERRSWRWPCVVSR
jgi:hypothetical protein